MAKKLSAKTKGVTIYTGLIYRLLLVFLMFTICRLFFYLYNLDFYQGIAPYVLLRMFLGGLRFDLTAILYINSLYILLQIIPLKIRHRSIYQWVSLGIYVLTNFIGIAMNIADTAYYRFTQKRTTASILEQFSNEEQMPSLLGGMLVEYWYLSLLSVGLTALLVYLYQFTKIRKAPADDVALYTIGQFLMMALSVYLVVVGMRGGFRHSTRPITLSNASAYIESPNQRAIVLNTPFAVFRTLKKSSLKEQSYFEDQSQQEKIFTALKMGQPDSTMLKKNVVIFILESFGREHIGALNKDIGGYDGYTPFLDSLIGQSYTFKHSYANGRKSISGMPSALAGIPSLVAPFILSHYSGNEINSIASLLSEQDYQTAFFHGARNGSMGFDAFARQSGYQEYFGKDEYGNDDDFDGLWGIWDEEFLQFFGQKMNEFEEPFCTTVFTVSSHHPFVLPEKYQGKFPEGTLKIHQTIGYTDFALKRFFEEARKSDWYKNTIFVLTADHASTYSDYPKYKTSVGTFTVPIIFFDPGGEMVGMDEKTVVQQSDIMPTLLTQLNYPEPYIAFGNDVFDKEANHFAVNYVGDSYQFIQDGYMMQFNGRQVDGLYDLDKDELLKNNLKNTGLPLEIEMERNVKAFIQEYNRRLINDDMIVNQ